MSRRRTFYRTSAAARAARRTIERNEAMRAASGAILSRDQWNAVAVALETLRKRLHGNALCYTTASEIALACGISLATARRGLRKAREMGMLRHHPASGTRPEMFLPRMWP